LIVLVALTDSVVHAPTVNHNTAPQVIAQGTPVTFRSETTVPVTQPAAPTTFEFWTPILAFAMLVSAVMALFHNSIAKKIKEAQDNHRPAHEAIDKSLHRLSNELAKDGARIHQLEQFRNADVERIVRLETNLTNIEKGQERIEHSLEKMEREGKEGRAEIIDSLRELRSVAPKG
jgi:septal ring factor EnvC (AmiA/AmiB activator)